jgi:phosphoribosylformylglycinamidine (FGAM) synthase-like amidotransferase family enzyme
MPHPERACEARLGCEDGRWILESLIHWHQTQRVARAA